MPTPKKSLGQNFLMHPQTAERIVRAADLPSNVTVLEIGPGTGMLTRALLSAGHAVVAVEADGGLVRELEEKFADEINAGKLTLVHEDIRNFDIRQFLTNPRNGPICFVAGCNRLVHRTLVRFPRRSSRASHLGHSEGSYALVANIPYYLTGEIIRTFLTAEHKPVSMTLLVQKEVAERIARASGKRPKESLLSLGVKAFGMPRYCFTVPRGAFRPAPSVDSAVISIRDIRTDAFSSPEEETSFFSLLRTGFAHKRKFLTGNLAELFPPEVIDRAFEAAALPKNVRGEDLTLADWQNLARELPTNNEPSRKFKS